MPSTYAHKKFALEVMPLLPEEARENIERNLTLYLTGCHGPDILFYYKPLKRNEVNGYGYHMHTLTAAPFFAKMRQLTAQDGALEAYILGFITHFALDSTAHGYVESERKALGITHTKLEVEFDAYLLRGEGKNAVKQRLADHIQPKDEYARVIAKALPFTPKVIKRALKDMRRVCNLFRCPNGVKRGIVRGVLKMVSRELPDQVMQKRPDPVCAESNAHMAELYKKAVITAKELVENYLSEEELSQRFDADFE